VFAPVSSRDLSFPNRDAGNILLRMHGDMKIREAAGKGLIEIDDALHFPKPGLEGHNVVIGILVMRREGAVDLRPVFDLLMVDMLRNGLPLELNQSLR